MFEKYQDDKTILNNEKYIIDNYSKYKTQYPKSRFIMIDLQQFKSINDNYGYLEGDSVLRIIGDLIKIFFNDKSDLTARLHGDEFCILTTKSQEEIFNCFKKIDTYLELKFNRNETKSRVRFNSGDTKTRSNYEYSQNSATIMLHESKRLGNFYVPFNVELISQELEKTKYLEETDKIISSGEFIHKERNIYTNSLEDSGIIQLYTRRINGESFIRNDIIVKNQYSLQELDMKNIENISNYIKFVDDAIIIIIKNNTLSRIDEILRILNNLNKEDKSRIIFAVDMHNIESRDIKQISNNIKNLKNNHIKFLLDKSDTSLSIDNLLDNDFDYVRIDPNLWKKAMYDKKSRKKLEGIIKLVDINSDSNLIFDYITNNNEMNFIKNNSSSKTLYAGEYLSEEKPVRLRKII